MDKSSNGVSLASSPNLPFEEAYDLIGRLAENIGKVVLGKDELVQWCLVALLSAEHVLLEDVPGVGKTLMGKALAKSISGDFKRLQFTPDLLPSDIVGSSVYDMRTQEFVFHPGPIFCNFVLADEINRAPARTQSALLEAMSDHAVSVDGVTRPLPAPFMVIATQNPYEFEGTYALPESQLDRFLLRVGMGYPDHQYELSILTSHQQGEPVDDLSAVVTAEQLQGLQSNVRQVKVDATISNYLLDIVHATRSSGELTVGCSTRGALLWHRAVQAFALLNGRDYAVPDDVKLLAVPVLAHRVMSKEFSPSGHREVVESIITQIVQGVASP